MSEEILKLNRLIVSYNKLIIDYSKIELFKKNKPLIYNRLIQLIIDKKLKLISNVKLGVYTTGTHARHLDNSQMSIVKDLTNNKFQYFIKVRKLSTLVSREPKLKLQQNLSSTEELKLKESYQVKLLRLGQIKHWVSSMAEKQGLFTHMVNPAYTSQECSVCHYVSKSNRTKQEEFSCKNPKCNHKENADNNATKVIKSRLLNKNLRVKLGKDNVYLCSRTKSINYKLVKTIVNDEYKLVVINELLPKDKLAKSKEDSGRNLTEAPT